VYFCQSLSEDIDYFWAITHDAEQRLPEPVAHVEESEMWLPAAITSIKE